MRVAEVLSGALGVDAEPELRQFRAGDIRHCFADIGLAKELLGYTPAVSFDDGMADLVGRLAEQQADDVVEAATDALVRRGLTA